MSSIQYSNSELEKAHPRLRVPNNESLDLTRECGADQAKQVLHYGLQIARRIKKMMTEVGGTKYENEPSHSLANPRQEKHRKLTNAVAKRCWSLQNGIRNGHTSSDHRRSAEWILALHRCRSVMHCHLSTLDAANAGAAQASPVSVR